MQVRLAWLIGCCELDDLENLAMTIIVFLLDNSAAMNQRTFQGTTLLDVAKSATEVFFKIRMSKSRVDRYFVLTLNSEPNYIKLTGWKQNVDIHLLHSALNNIKPDGQIDLSTGIQRTFRMLNINRLQLGLENYGMVSINFYLMFFKGIYPSCIEPAVVICITGSISACTLNENVINDASMASVESAVLGTVLTKDPYRWDYRLYSVVLRYPAFVSNMCGGNFPRPQLESPLKRFAEETGGENFDLYDGRELHQCLESLVTKCQPAVVLKIQKSNEDVDDYKERYTKQLMIVKLMGRVSSWPIPEPFWAEEEMVASQLPTRTAHPEILVSKVAVAEPVLPEFFPIDRYELSPSQLTKELLNSSEQNMVWRCFSCDIKKNQNSPFGYLKASSDLQSVHLHVLPFNYPVFLQLLGDIWDNKRMTDTWGHQFINYLSSIPKYYFMPLSKSFERIGFAGMIKPEAIDRALPYQLKHSLQKLRHTAKIEYDNFVRMTQSDCTVNPSVTLPSTLLPLPLWPLREFKSMYNKPRRLPLNACLRPCNISRCKLRIVLGKMRQDLDNLLSGRVNYRSDDLTHQQPVALMGDYVNYRSSRETEAPLREINPTPERSDTFGNPFRRKSSSFIADEGFVDEMDSLNVNSCNPNASLVSPGRKKCSQVIKSPQMRVKGPLPHYINHRNWRLYSPKSSPASSPRSGELSDVILNDVSSPVYINDSPPVSQVSPSSNNQTMCETPSLKAKTSSSLEMFKFNKEIMRELINIVRQPCANTVVLFDRMNELTGSTGQRDAVVSMLMSEALRFRKSCLYLLLNDWRTWMLKNTNSKNGMILRRSNQVSAKINHFQFLG
ncbi:unnamed protein product [Trichobilharzia szidati]|nr:unnamed protein product [Trichobilharzia szidati]